MFVSDINNEHTCYFVAVVDDVVVGYCGMWLAVDQGQITNVAVDPSYRNQGIATSLINNLIEVCIDNNLESITLEVRESNVSAINLYTKLGFTNVGCRNNYYKNPTENGILMTKFLNFERND